MKYWKIACSGESYKITYIEAETLKDAIKIAEQNECLEYEHNNLSIEKLLNEIIDSGD